MRQTLRRVIRSRHGWPNWLNRRATGVVERLPNALLERFDGAVLRASDRIPEPVLAPQAGIRLYVAPANFAGQGFLWSRAVTTHVEDVSGVSMAFQSDAGFAFETDNAVPEAVYLYSTAWQRRQVRSVREGFSHALIEAERPLFGYYYGGRLEEEVRVLSEEGVQVAFVCHGTDIRVPSRHAKSFPDSPYRDATSSVTRALESRARQNGRLLARLGRPVFVSTPDLLLDVDYAQWLPVVVDCERWQGGVPPLVAARPLVVHAPSKAGVKGSELIDPVLAQLDAEGLIRYVRVEGVPSARMPDIYREADIVLDQFRLGSYGVAACEAMAAGRLVISHVSDQARAAVQAVTGYELPIVEARATDLEATIRAVVRERERYRAHAALGADFVREVHDGRLSARLLEEHFLSATSGRGER